MPIVRFARIYFILVSIFAPCLWAATGQEGASFLDIPVGAEPASLGSAYTALADNAYATVWNPAGLARADVAQLAATHESYLESINYEFLSAAIPGHKGEHPSGFGVSIQSLDSGAIDQRDELGNHTGSFSSTFDAYALGYGQALTEKSSLGVMTKVITEKISGTSASAYAVDFGWLYSAQKKSDGGRRTFESGDTAKIGGPKRSAAAPREGRDSLAREPGFFTFQRRHLPT